MIAQALRRQSIPALSVARQTAAGAWIDGCRRLARARLPGRPAPRDLGRIAVVAALGKENGIAEGARLQFEAFRRAGMDVELVDATRSLRSLWNRADHTPATTYVFHCGAPQTASLVHAVMPHAARAFRVGYWAWELPSPPAGWAPFGPLVDEVWTPSRFSRASLAQMFRCPVRVVPHIVLATAPRQRRDDAPFTVLVLADSRSSLSRKNASGALAAFTQAFGASAGARLVLKLRGHDADTDALRAAAARQPNVEVVSEHLSDDALRALFRRSDVLLSLHRAEGFGLPLLEAMAMGLVVVATGWSGNADFMGEGTAVPVPYRLVPVDDAAGIYAGSVWAEPDIAAAAAALFRLRTDRDGYDRLARAAHRAASDWAARDIAECVR